MLDQGQSVAEIATSLGLAKSTVCYHKRKLGYSMDRRFACRYDWEAVQEHYDAGHSVRQCRERFGFSAWAWTYAVRRGAIIPRPKAMSLEKLLGARRKRNRRNIKLRLLEAGLKENECEGCGISDWRGRPLSLALHHINADGHDNRLENLALLCPNCHSQTPNFAAKKYARANAEAA